MFRTEVVAGGIGGSGRTAAGGIEGTIGTAATTAGTAGMTAGNGVMMVGGRRGAEIAGRIAETAGAATGPNHPGTIRNSSRSADTKKKLLKSSKT